MLKLYFYNYLILVQMPNTSFGRLVAPPYEKVIFAFERNYITSAMRKTMLEMPVTGSFEL